MDTDYQHGNYNYEHDNNAPANDYIIQYDYIIHHDGCSHHIDNRSHCSHYDCTNNNYIYNNIYNDDDYNNYDHHYTAATAATATTDNNDNHNNNVNYINNFNNYFDNNNDDNSTDDNYVNNYAEHDDNIAAFFDNYRRRHNNYITITCENGDTYTISDGCHDCGHHHIINYNNNRHI